MISPVHRPAFRVGDSEVSWAEVVDDAERRGAVEALRADVRAAVAAVDAAPPADDAARQAAVAFRRARGLLAGEDLEAWLDHWAVTVSQWTAWTRREAGAAADQAAPIQADVDDLLWPSAVCGGALGRWARAHALARAAGGDEAVAQLRVGAATPAAVEREVQARHLDWSRLVVDLLRLDTLDMAREAVLCLTDDGLTPDQLAQAAGLEAGVERVDACLEDLAPAVRAALTGAQAGDVIPPTLDGDGFVVGVVRARIAPDPDDEGVAARAVGALGDRAVRRLLDEQVRWLDDV